MHSTEVGSACAGLVLDAGGHEVRSPDEESFSENDVVMILHTRSSSSFSAQTVLRSAKSDASGATPKSPLDTDPATWSRTRQAKEM